MDFIELKNTFLELLSLLKKFGDKDIRCHINEIERALYIIESESCSDDNEIKNIIRSLYRPKGALAEFYVWNNDINERNRINKQISDIGNKLWNYTK